ncbi:diguanylate cyclase [Aliiglaciecola sp. CAU 1673]|uniref:diguanylate cyclase domain-containing protein n=1 Tax=Aliiglaciecola sp. CAU 1673 TaxID=3032595 RepID=UPI0023D9CE27|nr:diguanylate cyclase [Aliiglaciecola sp. CAU 1673]MDF2180274.1 diguanylate cyclase [Aliiglaciecola sp. CAU 1673]
MSAPRKSTKPPTSRAINLLMVMQDMSVAEQIFGTLAHEHPLKNLQHVQTTEAALSILNKQARVSMMAVNLSDFNSNGNNLLSLLTQVPEHTLLLLFTPNMPHTPQWIEKLSHYLGKGNEFSAQAADGQAVHDTHALCDEHSRLTLNAISDAIFTCNTHGEIAYTNSMARQLTGWSSLQATGKPLEEVLILADEYSNVALSSRVRDLLLNSQGNHSCNMVLVAKDAVKTPVDVIANPITDASGRPQGSVIVVHDVTHNRIRNKLAYHDALTGLPNRSLLGERLNQAIILAIRHNKQVGILFIDLDHFKLINDSLGHDSGDQLLQSVARRMEDCVRTSDTVCRYGGDEFVILLAELVTPKDAIHVANKLLKAFTFPHQIAGKDLVISLSIGISVYPADADTPLMMLKHADTAMYRAKAKGRNGFTLFDQAELKYPSIL